MDSKPVIQIDIDFNAITANGAIQLTTPFIAQQIQKLDIKAGDAVVLVDPKDEFRLAATVKCRSIWGLVAVLNWSDWQAES